MPRNERWHIVYDEEDLGSYHSPRSAADDASGGHTFSPSNGVDFGDLDISEDIGEWETISPDAEPRWPNFAKAVTNEQAAGDHRAQRCAAIAS